MDEGVLRIDGALIAWYRFRLGLCRGLEELVMVPGEIWRQKYWWLAWGLVAG
jgi:hypothetical protein